MEALGGGAVSYERGTPVNGAPGECAGRVPNRGARAPVALKSTTLLDHTSNSGAFV